MDDNLRKQIKLFMSLVFILVVAIAINYHLQLNVYKKAAVVSNDKSTSKNINFIDDKNISTKVGDYTLWPLRDHVSGENEVIIRDIALLIDNGVSNYDIYNIINSVSYYCQMNNIKPLKGMFIETYVDDNRLRHTKIDIGPVVVEQIYDAEHLMQRVDFVDGSSTIDKFGTLYDEMYPEDKETFYNMLLEHGEQGELYAAKEYNCCWYLFYTKGDKQQYIRINKDTNEIVDKGTYTDDGERISDK